MALTLEAEQKLLNAGLVTFFEANQGRFCGFVQRSYGYVTTGFPADATIRPDDVAKTLYPMIEVDTQFRAYLAENKLTQKYWVRHYGDLLIDRCWPG